MGRKLDFLLCRNSRQASKLKTLLSATVSRLAVLRNQRQARCSLARSDVAQLLELGLQDRALLRSEQVIKEQNMLDAFVLIEDYCHLLTERSALLGRIRECPDELKEAISGLVFAASRCGELPELLKLRYIFASKFGSEFTSAAVELRNNCGVNPKLIQKLSTRQPAMESKIRITKEIAAEKGIKLDLGLEPPIEIRQVDQDVVGTESQPKDAHDQNAPTKGSRFDAGNPKKDDKREGNIIQSDKAWLDRLPSTSSSDSTEYEREKSFDGKPIELNSESIDTREALFDKSDSEARNEYGEPKAFDAAGDEVLPIKHKPSYLRPPYQKSNPGRIHGGFDGKDRLGSGIVDEYANYHYTEKLNVQCSSVDQKPVSVRTRRGL